MTKLNSILVNLSKRTGAIRSDKLLNNIFWNSVARFGSAGLNFLQTLFLMSVLTVSDYGEFVFLFSVYATVPFVLDFGLNNSLVSIGARIKVQNHSEYQELISTHFFLKALIVFVIAVVSVVLMGSGQVDQTYIYVILLGAGLGLWECLLAIFKSQQDFKFLSQLIPARNGLALLGVLLMHYAFNVDDARGYLMVIMLVPITLAVCIYFKIFRNVKIKLNKALLKETFHVSKWLALFTLVTAIHSKTDIYLLKYFSSKEIIGTSEIGIFSAAFSLLALTNVLTSTFAEAILPKVSSEGTGQYMNHFLRRLKRTIPFVILFATVLGAALYLAFTFGFENKYQESVNSMIFIGIGMVLTFYIHTINTLFYPLGRTDVIFKIILIMFVTNIVTGFLLIPLLGAEGAAIGSMLVSAVGLFCTYFALATILKDEGIRTD